MHGIFDIPAVKIRLHRQINDRLHRRCRRCLASLLCDSLLQQFDVHLKADSCDMPMLLRAKKAPRAADLKIAHSNFKTGAELREFLHRLQAFFGRLAKSFIAPIGKVRKCHFCRTPDAPAHLIEL